MRKGMTLGGLFILSLAVTLSAGVFTARAETNSANVPASNEVSDAAEAESALSSMDPDWRDFFGARCWGKCQVERLECRYGYRGENFGPRRWRSMCESRHDACLEACGFRRRHYGD